MRSGSVHCCITSPPYWGQREYGKDPGMIGLEPTLNDHIASLVEIFHEVKRVLHPAGTLWIVYGDAYTNPNEKYVDFLPDKSLIGIPWRLALSLQDDYWILRNDIIWHKPNVMPESAKDRFTRCHEYIFHFSKSKHYYHDFIASEETRTGNIQKKCGMQTPARLTAGGPTHKKPNRRNSRNRRTVLTVGTVPFKKSHFATFPPALIKPLILSATSEKGCCAECGTPWIRVIERKSSTRKGPVASGFREIGKREALDETVTRGVADYHTLGWRQMCACDTEETVPCIVLDPFSGAGTTGLAACSLSRRYIGIEINKKYAVMSEKRIKRALL